MSMLEQYPYPELYRVIGEHPEAGREDIEAAYFRQVAAHRDRPERMHAIGAAGVVLLDREMRRAYDRQQPRPAEGPASPHLRRLVRWGIGYLGSLALIWGLVRPANLGSLLLMAYLIACLPIGWGAVRRPLRWLGPGALSGPCLRLAGAAVTGPVIVPVELGRSVAALLRLASEGPTSEPRWLEAGHRLWRRALRRLPRSIRNVGRRP